MINCDLKTKHRMPSLQLKCTEGMYLKPTVSETQVVVRQGGGGKGVWAHGTCIQWHISNVYLATSLLCYRQRDLDGVPKNTKRWVGIVCSMMFITLNTSNTLDLALLHQWRGFYGNVGINHYEQTRIHTHTQIPALAKLLEVQLSLLVAFSNGMKFPFFFVFSLPVSPLTTTVSSVSYYKR